VGETKGYPLIPAVKKPKIILEPILPQKIATGFVAR
jgi:hypothetical protein